ncbi:hypothetical protein ACQZV8_07560 [Magnetococcales bacterium HHB-1]
MNNITQNNLTIYIVMFFMMFLALPASLHASSPSSKPHQHHKAEPSWSVSPRIITAGGGRSHKNLRLLHLQAEQIAVFSSVMEKQNNNALSWNIPKKNQIFTMKPGKSAGGYHWLSAVEERLDQVRLASTMVYFSRPAPAPTAMLTQRKSLLEIIPTPMPREHSHYRAGEIWSFLIRFHGKPLANKSLQFQSEQGMNFSVQSDSQGVARVTFPEEFIIKKSPIPQKGHHYHRRPQADFVLTVTHQADGKTYLTSFNHHYRPGAWFHKSLIPGVGFLFAGMLIATPLLRKRDGRTS